MKAIIPGIAFLFVSSFAAIAQEKPSPEAEAFFRKAMSQINIKHVNWVKRTATGFNARQLRAEDAISLANSYAVLGSMNGQDIEALAFLVLMQASKSAQEDLKAIMAGVKAINEAKAKQRELLDSLQKLDAKYADKKKSEPVPSSDDLQKKILRLDSLTRIAHLEIIPNKKMPATKGALDQMIEKMKEDLDSMSEMGEMESLRLQMAMDRLSKMISTLSNILKKISDTQDTIIQNLK